MLLLLKLKSKTHFFLQRMCLIFVSMSNLQVLISTLEKIPLRYIWRYLKHLKPPSKLKWFDFSSTDSRKYFMSINNKNKFYQLLKFWNIAFISHNWWTDSHLSTLQKCMQLCTVWRFFKSCLFESLEKKGFVSQCWLFQCVK